VTLYHTIKNTRQVEPSQEDLRRIAGEREITRTALASWSEQTPQLDFAEPVEGPISSVFGLRRFFNEQPRKPHSGLDIAAAQGTPIRAPAAGTVLHAGEFFFSGNVVYLDHGSGLVTMYAHMDQIDVDTGQQIGRGQVIGAVGMTGRVTGAHLHWGVYLNEAAVDPTLFLAAGE
jgi:murein DD-endopeptidase MepM/ murein hydrolase activator NlpD